MSNPSYQNARILELLPESLNDFIGPDQTLLYENSDELNDFIKSERIQLSEHDDVARFLDQVIAENYRDIITKKIMFNL